MGRLACLCDAAGIFVIAVAAALFAWSAYIAGTRLHLDPHRHGLAVANSAFHRRYDSFTREFPLLEDAVVVVAGPSLARNHQVVDAVGACLRADPTHYAAVYDRIDTRFVRGRLLQFVAAADLRRAAQTVREGGPYLRELLAHPDAVHLFHWLDARLHAATHGSADGALPSAGQARHVLPILTDLLDDLSQAAADGTPYRSPWRHRVDRVVAAYGIQGLPERVYLDVQHGKLSLVLLRPAVPATEYVGVLRRQLAEVGARFGDVSIGLTGKPVAAYDQVRVSADDSLRAIVVSLGGVCLLLLLSFHGLARPLLATACLVLALGWTLAFAALTLGHLDAVTVIAMPMLIGLGIDFSIQVMTRYEEERGSLPPREAMTRTLRSTGQSVIAASLTIAIAFSAIALTGLQAMRELAVLAAVGIVLCALAMLIVFPACLLLHDRGRPTRGTVRSWLVRSLAWTEDCILAHAPGVLALTLVATVLCLRVVPAVKFDSNLLDLQANDADSIMWEQRLAESSGHGVMPAAVVADDVAQAQRYQEALAKLPSVARVFSPALLFPPAAAERVPAIRDLQATLPQRAGVAPPIRGDRLDILRADVASLRNLLLGLYPVAQRVGGNDLAAAVRDFVLRADRFGEVTAHTPRAQVERRLSDWQQAMGADLAALLDLVQDPDEMRPLTVATLPPALHDSVVSRDGRILVTVFPHGDIWDPATLERFITQLRDVDPDVTGFPVEIYESARAVQAGYEKACWFAALAVLLVILAHFRAVVPAALAMASVGLAVGWLLGAQVHFDVPFNLANKIVVPLLLGIGAANAIYVVRRCQEQGDPAVLAVSTGRAILLSNMMAIIGFASLLVARYQGMASIGLVVSLGLLCGIAVALIVLPALLELLRRFAPGLFWGRVARAERVRVPSLGGLQPEG